MPGIGTWLGRRLHQAAVVASLAALTFAVAGCGGDEENGGAATTVDAVTTQATSTVPVELVGTYERNVEPGLAGGVPPGVWTLAIGPRGEFFNIPPGETGFFNSPLTVSGDSLEIAPLPEQGCTTAGTYTFVLAGPRPGGTLTLTLVEDQFCEGRASLLTSGPWKRTD